MAKIEVLAPHILQWEGGFVNDPADKGGATNKGVTIATWRQCGYDKDGDGDIDVDDLKLISKQDVIDRVLKPHYWDKWKADQINSQKIANILVDWVWGSGKWGITIPQKILGVVPDGIVGVKTLQAVNAQNPDYLYELIYKARVKFFNDICVTTPTNKKFLKGWLNRLNDIKNW